MGDERIWAARSKSTDATMWWPDDTAGGKEYIRKDVADAAVKAEREAIAAQTRQYASHYKQGSDGRNTFVILADWIDARGDE